ncbi:MAG: HmuY family protein [Gemmatimonadota bacterium]
MSRLHASVPLVVVVTLALAACGSDAATAPTITPVTAQLTVDGSTDFAYVHLGATATTVTPGDAATSAAWDLGFFATNVIVNGGAVGPGGVTAYCLCQNASVSDAALAGMTASSELAGFEAVTSAQVPAADAFTSDTLTPAIAGWFSGSGASSTAATGRAWLLRKGTTTVTLGKFRVTALANASATSAGQVTFEYALQATAGGDFAPSQSRTVDVRSGPVYFDLSAGTTTTAGGSWDVRFSGFEIRANGGVSGTGSMSALVDNGTPYASITAAYAATAPAQVFKKDAYSGVFVSKPWYRYNITGTDNQIWPTYNVYLVKRGDEIYKVQLTSYYGTTGTSRQITIRYARLQ